MIRLLLLIGAIYVLYKGRKAWQDFKKSYRTAVHGNQSPTQIDDVMVQDPFCEVYFPKKDGLHVRHGSRDLYFCSRECKNNYFNSNSA